jgi:uncharacterized membrane protein required for colicin V production
VDVAEVGGVNAFDAGFSVLLLVLSLVGVFKGVTRFLVGMTALVAAFLVAAARHGQVAAALVGRFETPPLAASLIGYGALFIGVMLAGALVLPLARGVVRLAMLAWADRLAGAAAGLAGAVLIAGSVVVPVLGYVPAGDLLLAESRLGPYAVVGADAAVALAPAELRNWYHGRMRAVEEFWRARAEMSRALRRPGPGPAPPVDPLLPRLPW